MRLKEIRKNEKLTQSDIAKKLNIPLMTYNNYENEKTEPTIDTLCKLADYYGVTLDYLVGREFSNELGYLTQTQKMLLQIINELTEYNQAKLLGMAQGLLVGQN